MRHKIKTVKLGRSQSHRDALLANQAISLIEHSRIQTTLAKAKAVRPFAEKLVTLAKSGTLHDRRTALALLQNNSTRTAKAVSKLFTEIGPRCAARNGGYCRIIKLGERKSDSAPIAILEWVDAPVGAETATTEEAPKAEAVEAAAAEEAPKKKAARKPKAAKAEAAAAE
jgi:large subunit ribosomal protein L17